MYLPGQEQPAWREHGTAQQLDAHEAVLIPVVGGPIRKPKLRNDIHRHAVTLPDVGARGIEHHHDTDAVTVGLAQSRLNVLAHTEPVLTAVRSQ
jgi:hypothetical protein